MTPATELRVRWIGHCRERRRDRLMDGDYLALLKVRLSRLNVLIAAAERVQASERALAALESAVGSSSASAAIEAFEAEQDPGRHLYLNGDATGVRRPA